MKGQRAGILLGGIALTLSTLFHGFSYNFWWALTSRLAQGCSNGIIITSKSIVSTTCDDSNMPLAMAMITGTYACGLIIGPSLGGNKNQNVSFKTILKKDSFKFLVQCE